MSEIHSYLLRFFTCLMIFFPLRIFSQEIVKELTLVYDISLTSKINDPIVKSFEGATSITYIKGNLARTEISTKIGTESNIYNSITNTGFILKEYSGQKLLITLIESNWVSRNRFYSNITFENTNDEIVINGFKCKRAKVLTPDSYVEEVCYLTEKKIFNQSYYGCFSNLSGIPVKYSIKKDDRLFTYTLRSINFDDISSSKFEEPQSGFRKIKYEEVLQVKEGEK